MLAYRSSNKSSEDFGHGAAFITNIAIEPFDIDDVLSFTLLPSKCLEFSNAFEIIQDGTDFVNAVLALPLPNQSLYLSPGLYAQLLFD